VQVAAAPENCAYVGLGGNLGDVLATFVQAVLQIQRQIGAVSMTSSVYRTRPHRLPNQVDTLPDYWNAVCRLETKRPPLKVLSGLQAIERALGRTPAPRWAARRLDLDLLLMGDQVLNEPSLVLPHPRLRQRLFVLVPLAELAPALRLPPNGCPLEDVLKRFSRAQHEADLLERRAWPGQDDR
jgi:2-amino-4-hydroxy-6-hydroxymethyldihydropteridine diphosphokinase